MKKYIQIIFMNFNLLRHALYVIIFDAKQVIRVYSKSLFFAYQVVLNDNRILNVIVSQRLNQELIMLYGMRTKKLNDILKKLDSSARPAYYKNVINLSHEKNPLLSHWTVWKINITPLVIPLRRFGL